MMMERKRKRSLLCSCLPSAILVSAAFFICSAFMITDKERFSRLQVIDVIKSTNSDNLCEKECRLDGSELLPRGIVARTSDLEMRSLWEPVNNKKQKSEMNLLAIAVGIKQKENVNTIVKKFPSTDYKVMLFHYDGNVDGWNDLEWSSRAVHVSAINQTKWWFAKRFLHPDIIAEYAYIFLWDEDLGVENFHVDRYLSIVKEEGLEISQPAIDADVSEVHHKITAREKNSKVHRREVNPTGPGRRCYENSTEPPCTGWVEMMAPVFSRASWRCAWYMIQNDLISGWGLDFQLGHCTQGNRTQNIGVVDSEYLVHLGLPTLGGSAVNEMTGEATKRTSQAVPGDRPLPTDSDPSDIRTTVRKQSYIELDIFKNRWRRAVIEDKCWADPFHS